MNSNDRIVVQALPHADMGASGSKRWLNCPGSLVLKGADDKGGDAAWKGSVMHAVAEAVLCEEWATPYDMVGLQVVAVTQDGIEVEDSTEFTPEMAKLVAEYTDHCARLVGQDRFVELEVKLGDLHPDLEDVWGTVDYVVKSGLTAPGWHYSNTLHIVDLKTGNVPVGARENTQLMIYALGAMAYLYKMHDRWTPESVVMTIVQPKAGGVKTWSTNRHRMEQFARELLAGVNRVKQATEDAAVSEDGDVALPMAHLKAGDWCRYCPAIATCPAQAKRMDSMALEAFGKSGDARKGETARQLSSEQIGEVLAVAPVVEAYIKQARKEAIKRIQGGDHVPGFELGPGRRSRRWVDEDAARRYLSSLGVNLATPTPAAAERS